MENVVSARIVQLQVLDPGEIRRVQLLLPDDVEIEGRRYEIHDTMRPGTAFLAKPWGGRTRNYRRRMYTRSNAANIEPRVLETFINDTHLPQSDTSPWWQSREAETWYEEEGIAVRVTIDKEAGIATVYENASQCKGANLRLEPDGEWEGRRLVCVAFGTGVTPFLSYVRYMAEQEWTKSDRKGDGFLTLIASVRHERQLMLHQDLLKMAQELPQHFRYLPVLTRSWPSDWSFMTGRIIRSKVRSSGEEQIDPTPLLELVPNLSQSDLRMCGSVTACRQVTQGLKDYQIFPLTVRTESW